VLVKDGASFESQQAEGIINCPVCDDHQVDKLLSPSPSRRMARGKSKRLIPCRCFGGSVIMLRKTLKMWD